MSLTLKGARVNAGLNQSDVAKAIKVTPTTIGNWEMGKTCPKIDQVFKLAKLYGVDVNDLIFLKSKSS